MLKISPPPPEIQYVKERWCGATRLSSAAPRSLIGQRSGGAWWILGRWLKGNGRVVARTLMVPCVPLKRNLLPVALNRIVSSVGDKQRVLCHRHMGRFRFASARIRGGGGDGYQHGPLQSPGLRGACCRMLRSMQARSCLAGQQGAGGLASQSSPARDLYGTQIAHAFPQRTLSAKSHRSASGVSRHRSLAAEVERAPTVTIEEVERK